MAMRRGDVDNINITVIDEFGVGAVCFCIRPGLGLEKLRCLGGGTRGGGCCDSVIYRLATNGWVGAEISHEFCVAWLDSSWGWSW